jgi:hypothetical protein
MQTILSRIKHTFDSRSATPEDEARFVEIDEKLDRAELPEDAVIDLDDEARSRLDALEGSADVMRCVLSLHESEEPLFYLDGVLAPLWALVSAACRHQGSARRDRVITASLRQDLVGCGDAARRRCAVGESRRARTDAAARCAYSAHPCLIPGRSFAILVRS